MLACHWLMAISSHIGVVLPPLSRTGVERPSTSMIVPLVEDGDSPVAIGKTREA